MNVFRVFVGISIGFLIGGAVGLLNAPDKGYKTRKRLTKDCKKRWKKYVG